MISINLVLFVFGLFVILTCIITNYDFSSPGFIYCSSFFLCLGCILIVSKQWEIFFININTFNVLVLSTFVFLFVEYFIKYSTIVLRKNQIKETHNIQEKIQIQMPDIVIISTILLSIICIIWCVLTIFRFDGYSLNLIMASYKNAVNLDASNMGIDRKILSQLSKILLVLNYIFLYVYCYNNSIQKIQMKKRILFIFSFVIYILFRLLFSGGRQSSIFFIVAYLTCNLICNIQQKSNKKIMSKNRKYIATFIIIILIMIPTFYIVGRLVGRKESQTIYEAAINYLATGIYYLNIIVSNSYSSSYFGEITFTGLYPYLKTFKIIPFYAQPLSYLPFSYHGNTVTLLGRWYWDFGLTGVLIMTGIISYIFNFIYYIKIKNCNNWKNRHLSIIFYIFLIHILYFAGYDDFSFNLWTINYIITFFLFYIFYKILIKNKSINLNSKL